MRTQPGPLGPIQPAPKLPATAAAVATLVEDLAAFYDDGNAGLQRLVSRIPMLLDVERAYIARLSADGSRFTVSQTSAGEWPDLLGYTQSVARLPAFVRGTLKEGMQGSIPDCATFPFTAQQRKMQWYAGVRATVLTPIPSINGVIGALVFDMLQAPRTWDTPFLETAKTIADAVGARISLARLGDHLASEERDRRYDEMRLNVLANVARLREEAKEPDALSSATVELLAGLDWVKRARLAGTDDSAHAVRQSLATEQMIVRLDEGEMKAAFPLISEGERFGAIELTLVDERLSADNEQFLRALSSFVSSAYVTVLRRQRPRNEPLVDALTGLPNYRSVNEVLVDAVHHAKSSSRPVSVWLLDIEGLDNINRTHGYAIGDDVVGYVGVTLGASVGSHATAGRVGGGVFLALFPNVGAEEAAVSARILVERITRNAPAHLPDLGLTVGVASYPAHAVSHDDLVRAARLALYAAKALGPNRVVAAMTDPTWVANAQSAFLRIIAAQQLPSSTLPRVRA